MYNGLQVDPEEQLPKRYEDFLASIQGRLEDFSLLCGASARSQLDHRCHSSAKWLRWVHKAFHEVDDFAAGNLEDIGCEPLVAPQHNLQ